MAWFRAYDTDSGRWINRDPIEEMGGVNIYKYAFNSPIIYRDPLGLENVSITHYNKGGIMVHSEVPRPGQSQGGVHIQVGKAKYHFNTQTGTFANLPKDLAKKLADDEQFRKKITTACERVNQQGGFAPKYGGGFGRFIPALTVVLILVKGDAMAQEIANTGRDYYRNLKNGDDVTIEAAILRNQLNNLTPLGGELAFPTLLK